MPRLSVVISWLAAYLLVMGMILWGLSAARQSVLAKFSDPATLAAWQAWAEETRRPARADEPVARRPVKSDEPPSLVLMRDHFRVIQVVCVSISSFLFAFLGFLGSGLWKQRGSLPIAAADQEAPAPHPRGRRP